ncbi:MAG: Ig-like domain repeat protein [Acidobacteriota bacterium]
MLTFILCGIVPAQSLTASRIGQPINDQVRVTLHGNVNPLARARYDLGTVANSFPASRMLLLLSRPPEKEAALQQFLKDAHTLGNAAFHHWLTPQQFGALYGPQDADVAAVSGWLQQHGFSIERVTPGKTAIEFSGTAGQVRQTFHTEIHAYRVNGQDHYANNVDPQIPAALAPVVAGITPINDFLPRSNLEVLGKGVYQPRTHQFTPAWTYSGNPLKLVLGPGDFAVQYDLNPLYKAGLDGTGVTIGIIGASNIDPTSVENYHTMFGLPPLKFTAVSDGNDTNTNEGNWATGESALDVEVASSIAPGAMVNLYTAADTSVQSGLLLAAERAVDDDQAPVLSMSYAECEQGLGTAGNQFWAGLWEQAAAQGQTVLVSSGDGGSAGCDDFNVAQPAQYGLAVNGMSSTPWNVSVGGTDFYYSTYNGSSSATLAQIGSYWNLNATNQPAVSLLKPVPEQPWNQAFGLNIDDAGVYDPNQTGPTIVGAGGGASSCTAGTGSTSAGGSAQCTGGYPKPAWQSEKGVPADKARDLPDVSLFASSGGNGSFWLECAGDAYGCTEDLGPGSGYNAYAVGGTSASAPAMAAIMAIIDQKYGPQGQANFIFYPLAAQHPEDFHDVAVGSNNVPCQQGTPDCTLSTAGDNTKGFYTLGHYSAAAGYNQATGLGSVDASLLVQNWNSLNFTPTSTALNVSQTSFPHGTPVTVDVSVSGSGGTPTGDVGLVTNASPASNTSVGELTLAGGAATTTFDDLPGGHYQLTAKYAGDTVFAPSSASVTLDVEPEKSTVSLTGNYWNSSTNAFAPLVSGASYPFGTYMVLDAQPRGANAPDGQLDGLATGTVTFTDSAGSSALNSGAVGIDRLGVAEWQPSIAFPAGTNSVSAAYPGDSSFQASTSNAPLSLIIAKASTRAFLSASPRAIAVGSATTLSLAVAVPSSFPPNCANGGCTLFFPLIAPPTGNVTFSFGNTQLGTAPLTANAGASGYAQAELNVSSLPLGNDMVTASYSGDANYGPATATFDVNAGQNVTVSAVANPSSVNHAEYTAITATVIAPSGMPTPTGTIDYCLPLQGGTPGSCNWSDTETLSNGSATASVPGGSMWNLGPGGTASLQVSYSGDSTYGPADTTVTFTVTPGATSPFTLSGTPLTIAAGATSANTSTVTVTSLGGFTGNVYLSCALTSSPAGATHLPACNIPASVDLTGATAVTAAMTISSTAPSTITTTSAALRRKGRHWIATSGGFLICGLLAAGFFPTSKRRRLWLSLIFLIALNGFLACGGEINGGTPQTQQVPGTTPGNYTFAVNGAFSANGISQSHATVTVTIQ